MKRIFIFITLLFAICLIIDSKKYLDFYQSHVDLAEYLKQEDPEILVPSHFNVTDKMKGYYRDDTASLIQFLFPLFVIMIGCYEFHNKLHSGFIKNVIMKEKYTKYLKREIFCAWKAAWFLPTVFLLIFVFSCFITNFNFSNTNSFFPLESTQPSMLLQLFEQLILCLNLTFVSIACINVGLLVSKKSEHFIFTVILSYVILVIYQVFVEIIIGPILRDIFHSNFFVNNLTLFGFWFYGASATPLMMGLYAFLLIGITCFLLKLAYKNKENVIIYAEK